MNVGEGDVPGIGNRSREQDRLAVRGGGVDAALGNRNAREYDQGLRRGAPGSFGHPVVGAVCPAYRLKLNLVG